MVTLYPWDSTSSKDNCRDRQVPVTTIGKAIEGQSARGGSRGLSVA